MKRIQKGKLDILKLSENITLLNIDDFKTQMTDLLKSASSHLILDLQEVKYINSSGLGMIAHSVMNAQKSGKELIITGILPPLQDIFEVVKFSTFMKLFLTLKEGEDYFQLEESH